MSAPRLDARDYAPHQAAVKLDIPLSSGRGLVGRFRVSHIRRDPARNGGWAGRFAALPQGKSAVVIETVQNFGARPRTNAALDLLVLEMC